MIPADVFQDVTSITVDEFRFLRDGGDYTDGETGEVKRFVGHLFDEVVFNDSVSEFIKLRERLANYFDESQTDVVLDRFGYWDFSYNLSCLNSRRKRRSSYGH